MSKKLILVIEDETDIRKSIRDLLIGFGYSVIALESGINALNIIKEVKPNLILCDIMMPVKSGFDVLKEIQEDDLTKNIPFIFLTALAEMSQLREGMNLGADDYITKPFRAASLEKAIETRLLKFSSLNKDLNKNSENNKTPKSIFINDRYHPTWLKFKDIIAIESNKGITKLYLRNGKKISHTKLLKDWEIILPDDTFLRVHRSTIINKDEIIRITSHLKKSFKVELRNCDREFIISDRYAIKLKKQELF